MKATLEVESKVLGKVAIGYRPVEPEDRDFLCKVYASTRREELAPLSWTDAQKQEFLKMQFEAQDRYYRKQYAGDAFLMIQLDGRSVGRLYVGRWEEEIRIIDIALLPEYRGSGIGSAILSDLLAEAESEGKPVRIHVEKQNPALRLYKRLGFVPIADRGVYDLMQWSPKVSRAGG